MQIENRIIMKEGRQSDVFEKGLEYQKTADKIENCIKIIRDRQVILDRDLARLYGVDTKILNQAVKRNIERFPEDFMFQLSKEEWDNLKSQKVITTADEFLRSQIVTIENNEDFLSSQHASIDMRGRHVKYMPYAFTENGIAMLSSVLRSPTAIATNIQIMRAFTAMRHFIASNAQVFQRLEVLERTQLSLVAFKEETHRNFEEIFKCLDDGTVQPTQRVFYDGQIFDAYTFLSDRIREANNHIVLIDNYVDDRVLTMLDKRNKGVSAKIYTKNISRQLVLDIEKHNAQYPPIEIELFDRSHDRWLCVDETVYHVGASLKDLGKKWFAFVKLEQNTEEFLSKI